MDIIEKIKKIKKLADEGFGGEQEAAKLLLDELTKKYNISEQDLLNEEETVFKFHVKNKIEEKLFFQCIAKVFGSKSKVFNSVYYYKYKKMYLFVEMTTSRSLLFNEFYYFHLEQFLNYRKRKINEYDKNLYTSYLNVHNIFDSTPDEDIKKENNEDIDILELIRLSTDIKKSTNIFHKALPQ